LYFHIVCGLIFYLRQEENKGLKIDIASLTSKLAESEAQRAADVEKIKTLEAALDTYSQNAVLTVTQQGLQVCYHNVVALRTV
jgi:regulator of replication initiation timing